MGELHDGRRGEWAPSICRPLDMVRHANHFYCAVCLRNDSTATITIQTVGGGRPFSLQKCMHAAMIYIKEGGGERDICVYFQRNHVACLLRCRIAIAHESVIRMISREMTSYCTNIYLRGVLLLPPPILSSSLLPFPASRISTYELAREKR